MGCHSNITFTKFPTQSSDIDGIFILRNDLESPNREIKNVNGKIYVNGIPPSDKQGNWLNNKTEVCYHFNTNELEMGIVIRDDMESPWITVIKTERGRYILTTECQHCPK